ncbi:rod shape-determining protein MreD [Iodobacter fluviatilis]|uniref:Rod shape-determining protein MreD n=1 Tax=Iodobacter fluviatilis TaxID=537 RepID=A0A7G3G867_9NEIS|nr:rod shape-determining protein MreD [Iodobacter fluviatilis]QBC43298.1 rod shape-determining protein MreD [Iodobacter fluviatilis]
MPISRQLLRPVSSSFILFTFVLSLSINLLPWQAGLIGFAPDFVALFIIYWTLNQPRRIGVGWAFFLGLLMDVADGNVLGQHALAYTVIAYLTLARQRQLAVFPFWQQAFVALALMLIGQVLMLSLRMLMGAPFPGWAYFAGCCVAAFIWPPLSNILLSHQRRPTTEEL